eukprot:TRINITY_DN17625_c0_g1_i2.p1 TRINITY_DN17625_c0_g1~~TRINITY_DN17625_c0_g1_i2.p1  ORF type:complete len:770 (+),score=187.66 TRINITY_DN17625_c0_g1_i2:101-2410(+)
MQGSPARQPGPRHSQTQIHHAVQRTKPAGTRAVSRRQSDESAASSGSFDSASIHAIEVCIRVCKPIAAVEAETVCVKVTSQSQVRVTDAAGKAQTFDFNRCYWWAKEAREDDNRDFFASQSKLHKDLGPSLVKAAIAGVHNCIFSYGAAKSGKSWTMHGGAGFEQEGMVPRVLHSLVGEALAMQAVAGTTVQVSYLEIRDGNVYDLLFGYGGHTPRPGSLSPLQVRESPGIGVHVPLLSEFFVDTAEKARQLWRYGRFLRTVDEGSCIFTIRISAHDNHGKGYRFSDTRLCDLERAEPLVAEQDAKAVNHSLKTLCKLILDLSNFANPKSVAYQDSPLSLLMKDSLLGNCKTVMIATISPLARDSVESLRTLRFAQVVKTIKAAPKINHWKDSNAAGDVIQQKLAMIRSEVSHLRQMSVQSSLTSENLKRQIEEQEKQFSVSRSFFGEDWENVVSGERNRFKKRNALKWIVDGDVGFDVEARSDPNDKSVRGKILDRIKPWTLLKLAEMDGLDDKYYDTGSEDAVDYSDVSSDVDGLERQLPARVLLQWPLPCSMRSSTSSSLTLCGAGIKVSDTEGNNDIAEANELGERLHALHEDIEAAQAISENLSGKRMVPKKFRSLLLIDPISLEVDLAVAGPSLRPQAHPAAEGTPPTSPRSAQPRSLPGGPTPALVAEIAAAAAAAATVAAGGDSEGESEEESQGPEVEKTLTMPLINIVPAETLEVEAKQEVEQPSRRESRDGGASGASSPRKQSLSVMPIVPRKRALSSC